MAFTSDTISINTVIGSGSSISGDIRVNGRLRIDGDIDGNLETTSNIYVGEASRIHGNIVALSAVIEGIVIGNITAPKGITLLSSSAVIGDVTTKRLQVEENVILHGHCISLKNEDDYNRATNEYLEKSAIRSKVV